MYHLKYSGRRRLVEEEKKNNTAAAAAAAAAGVLYDMDLECMQSYLAEKIASE